MNTIYQSLPERSASLGKVEDADKYEELQKQADALDKHLTAIEILQRSVLLSLVMCSLVFFVCVDLGVRVVRVVRLLFLASIVRSRRRA
eukprot:1823079-Rhodomonas_salina.2